MSITEEQMNLMKLFIGSGRCGEKFNTEMPLSVIVKFENGKDLTEKQVSSFMNIYTKCDVEKKTYYIKEWKAQFLDNLIMVNPLKCEETDAECVEWAFFKDNKYVCKEWFRQHIKDEAEKSLKSKFVSLKK
tara:strand:+ start:1819 stop:2211 length:393 start_codon:yes stop_codon:yes gene_type:complete